MGPAFKPVPAARQRAAVKFLVEHAFSTPKALLDSDVLLRFSPSGAADSLQGSNVQLLRQLIDPAVFQRMSIAQAMEPQSSGYTGIDLLSDLNDGLFRELEAPVPMIELYRRDLQRNYVTQLLVAAGVANDPQSSSRAIDTRYAADSSMGLEARHVSSARSVYSPLAEIAQKYRTDSRSSEFHAALRVGVGQLYTKIDRALKRVKDTKTSALLRELRAKLESVP